MPTEIIIPRLGWNMDEGIFGGWLVADGAAVSAGEPLFRLEVEKTTEDVEAADAGTLRVAPGGPQPGDRVAVGQVVGFVLKAGETPPALATQVRQPVASGSERIPTSEPVFASSARSTGRPRSSPLARRLARELDIDWTTLRGGGRSGRVRKADVLAAAEARQSAQGAPLSPVRRTIAARLAEGRAASVPVTITTTVDATNLVNLRRQFQAADGVNAPRYHDFLAKLAALALREHPALNAWLQGERLTRHHEAHIGLAVDTEAGLLVPVIRNADTLGLRAIADRSRELIGKARAGRLQAAETQGGTFTITSLGAFGIEAFTPVLNPPQCAILGLGRIERQPVFEGERLVGRERMVLSLTFDHRAIDGAPAARFLQRLGQLIANPAPWLVAP
jgi:pyruvate dehydrogenase E2 component (dihydrolipoamide acetyltransferase)